MTEILRYPYKWRDRKVLLQDGILFVPELLDHYEHVEISSETIFGNSAPLHVEYCSGNGAWIASKAAEFPDVNWIAIEKKFERSAKTWGRGKRDQLKNLFVICGEGQLITERYFKDGSISEVFVNFPDPWPKKRHWKHRIIAQPFLKQVNRVLSPAGQITFVTDDDDYSKVMTEELTLSKMFSPLAPEPFYLNELPGYGSSFFEEMWRAKGKNIYYHKWEKGRL